MASRGDDAPQRIYSPNELLKPTHHSSTERGRAILKMLGGNNILSALGGWFSTHRENIEKMALCVMAVVGFLFPTLCKHFNNSSHELAVGLWIACAVVLVLYAFATFSAQPGKTTIYVIGIFLALIPILYLQENKQDYMMLAVDTGIIATHILKRCVVKYGPILWSPLCYCWKTLSSYRLTRDRNEAQESHELQQLRAEAGQCNNTTV
ncbi:hypothetical protein M501DRAFT_988913 [Patellaria atrata CBS 101060]|uniref:Uncharacterized protein n=1 Tax=Patellaria atrata CBS 101060 TaxID=1346257 RepID=A0A9P4S308_9PEZI|nr:hypothetical protein M501DRAFT_988913 [Patellaria atrata CBS 101060]